MNLVKANSAYGGWDPGSIFGDPPPKNIIEVKDKKNINDLKT